jgi:hypothetical protein
MPPSRPLPLPPDFDDVETYIISLLKFSTSSNLLQTLCGGVHILDFFTRKPDLYSQILPQTWRLWFENVEISDILDFLMREDLDKISDPEFPVSPDSKDEENSARWRNRPLPPKDLVYYIKEVRAHLLDRTYTPPSLPAEAQKQNKKVLVGMNAKKAHEVENFSRYINDLTISLNSHHSSIGDNSSQSNGQIPLRTSKITHLVDFGAGQNYLGRALASAPYNQHIIAIESRPHVVEGAKKMDVLARLTERDDVRVNKKAWRAAQSGEMRRKALEGGERRDGRRDEEVTAKDDIDRNKDGLISIDHESTTSRIEIPKSTSKETVRAKLEVPPHGQGSVQYVEHRILDGNLTSVIDQIQPATVSPSPLKEPEMAREIEEQGECNQFADVNTQCPQNPTNEELKEDPSTMVISLHSCGNLLHHGLRTITLNPSVQAVALVGCCYNLMTERLGPPTFKIPGLRSEHPRLEATGNTCDKHGFPMSARLLKYPKRVWRWNPDEVHVDGSKNRNVHVERDNSNTGLEEKSEDVEIEEGIRLNITARMMAVQAPQNWSESESDSFFTRHFYRALLQRIFLDKGVIKPPSPLTEGGGRSPAGTGDDGTAKPILIGTLSKKCYVGFVPYVKGAVAKIIGAGGEAAVLVQEKLSGLHDEEILSYERTFQKRKKELSVVWSLMALSAGVVEAMIVVDRWLWLKEQECIGEAWVEPVFDYAQSPRNLVVVGIKK